MLRSLAKKTLTPAAQRQVKRVLEYSYAAFTSLAGQSKFTARLYYLFSSDMDREIVSLLRSKEVFRRNKKGGATNNYFLRRSVHRIEKGLLMRPRRSVFGEDYIVQTVDAFGTSIGSSADRAEIEWAQEVLRAYFEVVSDTPVIAVARAKFADVIANKVEPISVGHGLPNVPYKRDLAARPEVTFAQLYALASYRRSVRWYREKPVERALVDQALSVALQAPSACNRQPIHFHILENAARAQKVAGMALGTGGFRHNIPTLVAVTGRLGAFPMSRDRHIIYIDGSLAAMSFMLALETLGLSSCPINWPDVGSAEIAISRELGLEPDERVVMLLSIGYPDPEGMVAASRKVDIENARSFLAT